MENSSEMFIIMEINDLYFERNVKHEADKVEEAH